MSVIEQVRELTEGRAEDDRQAWLDLVALVADSDEPDAGEVLAALERLGRTADELQDAVATRRMRQGLREELAALPAKQQRAEKISAELGRLDQELAAAQQRHRLAVGPLGVEREVLLRQAGEGGRIRRELLESCPDPEVLRDIRNAERRLERQQAECRPIEAEAARLRQRIQDVEEAIKGQQPRGWTDPTVFFTPRMGQGELEERLRGLQHRMRELEAKAAPVRAAAARAAAEVRELTARAMDL